MFHPEEFSLSDVVVETSALVRPMITKKNINLPFAPYSGDVKVYADLEGSCFSFTLKSVN